MLSYVETLVTAQSNGPALTAAAAASCLPSQAKFGLRPNFVDFIGKQLEIKASGIISNVITTPGTARFDVRFGSTVVADTLAIPLNVVAKSNVQWYLELLLTATIVGGVAQFMMGGKFSSEAVVGSPLPSVGGSGLIHVPYNATPALGTAFDATAAQLVDMFFTQTVATGSMTLQQYSLVAKN